MSSLSAHLRRPEDHSGLRFHPSCPVCRRERLAGSLASDELLSRRTQAAIAASLLAFSGVGAPSAVAQEPDSVSEGTSEPMDNADPESFDIGDDTIDMPDAGPPPEAAVAPAEADVVTGADEEDDGEELQSTAGAVDDESVPLTVEPAPVEPAAAGAEPAPPAAETTAAVTPATETPPARGVIRAEPSKRRSVVRERPSRTAPEPRMVVTPTPQSTPAPTAAEPTRTVRVVAGTSGDQATPDDRFHTVRRGESLWSIASDLVGDDATIARVAREVDRLWVLNETRIATGNRDLLFAGTRLRLR